jgi:hypothetical protein
MQKKLKAMRLFTVLAAVLLFASCNKDIIEPESVDADYNVTYYTKPPHNEEQQGYLILKSNGETDFIELAPISNAPYTLIISVTDKKGHEAINHIKTKENSPIISIEDLTPGLPETNKTYKVVTTKYFQSRNFFVSESYKAGQDQSGTYNISVQPLIIVKMKAGQDVSTVEEEYKGTLTLKQENYDDTYLFSCKYKTSYEVLMLTLHVFGKLEVAWAEPVMSGTLPASNNR